jgi:hypothetical protein
LPHTGLIDESLDKEEALLMRARLHIRAGWNRLSLGMKNEGVAALYDALSSAMQSFLFQSTPEQELRFEKEDDLSDDLTLFKILKRSEIFDDSVSLDDFMYMIQTLDDALEDRLESFDETRYVETANVLLVQLGVLPFNMCELPDALSI